MLDTVHEPEKNAPSAPSIGEIIGNAPPASPAAASATAVSIPGSSLAPFPENVITCTIATLAAIAIAADPICFPEARPTSKISFIFNPKHSPEIIAIGKNGNTPGLLKNAQSNFPGKKPCSATMRPNDDSHPRNGKNSSRVNTRLAAIAAYGSHAFSAEISLRCVPAAETDSPRNSAFPQVSFGNRQTCAGTRKRKRIPRITIGKPNTAPSIDGNSGPRKRAEKYHGIVYANPAKTQNGAISKIERKRRSREVISTRNATAISGRNVPEIEKIPAVCSIADAINVPGSMPASMKFSDNVFCTVSTGVPAPPNGTGIVLQISATATAATAGKPSPTSNGAVNAAAAPKPAAPSINPLNSHASTTVCTRRSEEIFENELLIDASAPLFFSTFKRKIAPKIIRIISNAFSTPKTDAPAISPAGISQTKKPRPAEIISAKTNDEEGEKRKAPKRIIAATSGIKARIADIVWREKNGGERGIRTPGALRHT